MSATENVTQEQLEKDIVGLLQGGRTSRPKAERIFSGLVEQWGLPTTRVGPDGVRGTNLSFVKQKIADPGWRDEDETWLERQYGHPRPFLAGAAAAGVDEDERGSHSAVRAYEDISERATIDATSQGIKGASPIVVDPEIVNTLRERVPIVDRVTAQAQAGFQAQYNIVSARSDPVGFLSEGEAVDMTTSGSAQTPQDFTLGTETKDMKIHTDLVEISDFTMRAEDSLGYMNVEETTLGQRIIEFNLQKARAFYYGDPSQGSGQQDIEDGDAYPGMTKLANDASSSYVIDKSGVSSGFLADIRNELTTVVENTGLTYDAARIAVSPTMMDALSDQANSVTRLEGYSDDINFGRRSIQIKGVEVFEDPNIRDYSGFLNSTLTNQGDNGDVFIYDSRNLQFRQLAPLSTVPLGRVGLGDRVAMFEYGRLISKSQGEHIRVLQQYGV